MAGRGCTITVKLLGGGHGHGETEDISLPVALHSPLEVLKDELAQLCGIQPQEQVLILLDLSDPDRNSDLLLVGRDHMALRSIGITNGSVLTLHALGVTTEQQQRMMREAFAQKKLEVYERPCYALETPITASQADHSYNGIVFDVECNGPYEIDLISVSIAGMLGRIRIFARDRPWRSEATSENESPSRWWAHREGLSTVGWEPIADVHCRPSWDKPIEIKFNRPIKLLPRQRRALYCHSSLPDDLGIQYQSYAQHQIIAEDEYIRLFPGLGHTGSEPFDERHGWYRSYRGLSGGVKYHAKWKGWDMKDHAIFPLPLKQAVKTLLLCETRSASDPNRSLVVSKKPSSSSPRSPMQYKKSLLTSSIPPPNTSPRSQRLERSPSTSTSLSCPSSRTARYHISSLPKYVIIYILEFMNYDWFKELDSELSEENVASAPVSARKKNTLSRRFIHALGSMQPQNFVSSLLSFLQTNNIEIGSDDEMDEDDDEYLPLDENDEEVEEEEYYEDDVESEQVMEGVDYLPGYGEEEDEDDEIDEDYVYRKECNDHDESDDVPSLIDEEEEEEEEYHDLSVEDVENYDNEVGINDSNDD